MGPQGPQGPDLPSGALIIVTQGVDPPPGYTFIGVTTLPLSKGPDGPMKVNVFQKN